MILQYNLLPLFSFNNLCESYRYIDLPTSYMERVWVSFAFKEEAIEGPALTTLNHFVTQLGFDSEKVKFVASRDTEGQHHFKSKSAADVKKRNIIYIPQKALEAIAVEFSPVHKFILGHEISHLIRNGNVEHLKKVAVVGKIEIAAYMITFIALSVFSPFDIFLPLDLFLKHQMSLIPAYIFGVAVCNRISQQNELRHDIWSASQSSEMAQGGIQLFENIEREVADKKRELVEKEKGYTPIRKVMRRVAALFRSIFYPISINNHPPEKDRIDAIKEGMSAIETANSSLVGKVITFLTPHSRFVSNFVPSLSKAGEGRQIEVLPGNENGSSFDHR